jgi:hypothetical protein
LYNITSEMVCRARNKEVEADAKIKFMT